MKKSKIYNVIILDKSGSMTSISKQAVDGLNETLGAVRSAAERDTNVEQYVTIVAFCGCELKKLVDTKPIGKVKNISYDEYRPCCMTPLYDAIGVTVSALHARIKVEEKSIGAVTIITDGYENASKEFTGKAVKKLIEDCRHDGWLFTYIGADHDVEAVAFNLSINNSMRFDKTEAGTSRMYTRLNRASMHWNAKMSQVMCAMPTTNSDEAREKLRKSNEDFFDE